MRQAAAASSSTGPRAAVGAAVVLPKVHHWDVGAASALHGLRDRFLGSWLDQENRSCQNWRIQKSPQNLGGTHKTLAWTRIFLLYDLGIFAFHIAFSTSLGLSKAANVSKVFEDKISFLVCNSLGTIQGEPWCCANSVDWESAALDPQKMQQLGIGWSCGPHGLQELLFPIGFHVCFEESISASFLQSEDFLEIQINA